MYQETLKSGLMILPGLALTNTHPMEKSSEQLLISLLYLQVMISELSEFTVKVIQSLGSLMVLVIQPMMAHTMMTLRTFQPQMV